MPKTPPPQVDCPRCGAKMGQPCVNYLGKGKQTCFERLQVLLGVPVVKIKPKKYKQRWLWEEREEEGNEQEAHE